MAEDDPADAGDTSDTDDAPDPADAGDTPDGSGPDEADVADHEDETTGREVPLSDLRRRIEEGAFPDAEGTSTGDAPDTDAAAGTDTTAAGTDTTAAGTDTTAADDESAPAADAPLSDLARDARAGEHGADTDDEASPFEEMEVGDLDEETVWESVVGEEEDEDDAGLIGGGEAVVESEGETDVVKKREFCQRCRFFSEPPTVACGHEGTEIVEVVDSEQFRVRNCPMVGEEGRADFDAAVREDEP